MIVYLLRNKSSGRSYIGKTTRSLKQRLYEHRRNAENYCVPYPLYNAIRRDGFESFVVSILAEAASEAELNDWEKYWIRTLQSKIDLNGYNLTDGGDGVSGRCGWHHSDKTKLAISRGNKGKVRSDHVREQISRSVKSAMTTEVKKKISERTIAALSKPCCRKKLMQNCWQKRSKKIQQLNLEGVLIQEYPSAREASRVTGVNHGNLCSCARGSCHQAGGFVWRYAGQQSCVPATRDRARE